MQALGITMLDLNRLIHDAGVRSGHTVVDLQCGYLGACTFPAARATGRDGCVYAVDVRPMALQSIEGRKPLGYDGVIKTVHGHVGREWGVPLVSADADVALLVNVLSSVTDRLAAVREAHRLLTSAGTLLVVDWVPFGTIVSGPPVHQRVSEQEARSTCLVVGFDAPMPVTSGPYHYAFVCKKSL